MKTLRTACLVGALLASGAACADSMSLNHFTPRVLPVLVQVDSHGTVRNVSSAVELSPRYDRLLRQTLDQMINQPAHDHGHAVASQFVINLGLQATARPDGKYDAKFTYVSATPVPAGSWYWVHIDGHRLALANRNELPMHYRSDRALDQRWAPYPVRPNPPVQSFQHSTPAPTAATLPPGGHRH